MEVPAARGGFRRGRLGGALLISSSLWHQVLQQVADTGGGNNYAPPEPYEKIGFHGMGVTKPPKFVWFLDTHATEP